jgi:anti-sigma28 factor (negative regulator of flagellin synthesis)
MNLMDQADKQAGITNAEFVHSAAITEAASLRATSMETTQTSVTENPPAAAEAAIQFTAKLISQALSENEVRFELVAALRAKIDAGDYRVAASDIAESLINSLRS